MYSIFINEKKEKENDMKTIKYLSIILSVILAVLSFTGCKRAGDAETNSEESIRFSDININENAQILNPWLTADSIEEAVENSGLENFSTPAVLDAIFPGEYTGPEISYMKKLVELTFTSGSNTLIVRKSIGDKDISGDYTAYPEVRELDVNGLSVNAKGNDGLINLAFWFDQDFAYSVSYNIGPNGNGLSEDQLVSLISQIK